MFNYPMRCTGSEQDLPYPFVFKLDSISHSLKNLSFQYYVFWTQPWSGMPRLKLVCISSTSNGLIVSGSRSEQRLSKPLSLSRKSDLFCLGVRANSKLSGLHSIRPLDHASFTWDQMSLSIRLVPRTWFGLSVTRPRTETRWSHVFGIRTASSYNLDKTSWRGGVVISLWECSKKVANTVYVVRSHRW